MDGTDILVIDDYGAIGAKNLCSTLGPAVKGASLPGYHALSTAPHVRRSPGRPYRMDETDLLTAELSARLWRRYNGPIRLLTDPMGYEYVMSISLADAYDEILPVLDPRCCGIDPDKYWAASKIAALSKLPTPCVIMDMDMMIWKPLDLSGEKLVCACVEFISDTVYPPFSFFRTAGDYAFPADWSEEATALNTAFLYINDEKLKQEYTPEAFRFMLAERESPDYWAICMTFAEQRILGLCAESRGIYASLLYDMDKDCLTHTWGAKGKLRSEKDLRNLYLQTCREKLEQMRGDGAL